MAGVAQLVRVAVCGTVGRGFESLRSPTKHLFQGAFFVQRVFILPEKNIRIAKRTLTFLRR